MSELKVNQHRIYVAGPYRADEPAETSANIEAADAAGRILKSLGHYVYVPHTMTRTWDRIFSFDSIMENDLDAIRNWATALFVIAPHITEQISEGVLLEVAEAHKLNLRVFFSFLDVPSLTENRYVKTPLANAIDIPGQLRLPGIE